MRIVVQRVREASVSVAGKTVGAIGKGLLLLVGVAEGDTQETAGQMAARMVRMRIFEDAAGKMNLDVAEAGGKILSVPQFTLLADTCKGNRPGFDGAAPPSEAERIWKSFNEVLRENGMDVAVGEFGAHMEVSLVNDGPVTFIVNSKNGGPR